MFPINPSVLPSLRTRQALLVLDLQNDFILPDGALTVENPGALVTRTVEVAKAFRDSGAGDVIWVRSEFDRHRPLSLEGEQISTSEVPKLPRRTTASSRGRQAVSARHDLEEKENDDEAFLSVPQGSEKPACVRRDTRGARLAAEVEEAVDPAKDFSFTKTHYSAFASGPQLLQLLRGRFVTELYICGALTNISVYATALEAGQHGYQITIVEDCCSYRSDMRHSSAMHQLVELAGCEVMNADDVVQKIQPAPKPGSDGAGSPGGRSKTKDKRSSGESATASASGSSKKSPVRPLAPADDSSDLQSSLRNLTLSGPSSPGRQPRSPSQPQTQVATRSQPLQPLVKETVSSNTGRAQSLSGDAESGQATSDDAVSLDVNSVSRASAEGGEEADDSSRNRVVDDRSTPRRPSGTNLNKTPRVHKPIQGPKVREPSITSPASADSDTPQKPDQRRGSTSQAKSPSISKAKAGQSSRESASPAMDDKHDSDAPSSVSEPLCEGDTNIIQNVLPTDLASTAFERLETEVKWLRMSHQGGEVPRLVAVQGAVDDEGNMPVYRHPADESPPLLPFSPTVLEIKAATEKHLGHPLNHVLIQFYRDGKDYISEHSDKTLDIVPGSFIANVSLGAERTMVFRTKRIDKDPSRNSDKSGADSSNSATTSGDASSPAASSGSKPDGSQQRRTQRANLPHNSLCRMGLVTNMRWLHAIRQDKRLDREKTSAELAFGGRRISLTFRHIGTFLNAPQTLIWGLGAVAKTKASAGSVINGQGEEAIKMLRAFGTENHSSEFDRASHYGDGFDVLHMSVSPRFFTGPDDLVNARVALALAGMGIEHAKGSTGVADKPEAVRFVDNDAARSTTEGGLAVLLYLDAVYGDAAGEGASPQASRLEIARKMTRLQQALALFDKCRAAQKAKAGSSGDDRQSHLAILRSELAAWDGYAKEAMDAAGDDAETVYMAGGSRPTVADFALFPVLHSLVRLCGGGCLGGYKDLSKYYQMMSESEAAIKIFGSESSDGESDGSTTATPSK